MTVYIDTSAFLAILDADDQNHASASKLWAELLESERTLVSNSYVLVETFAVVQNRLGVAAVKVFDEDIFPLLRVQWVDELLHREAIGATLAANRRQLGLVDCSSFATMRRLGIRHAFAYDQHFTEQGFNLG